MFHSSLRARSILGLHRFHSLSSGARLTFKLGCGGGTDIISPTARHMQPIIDHIAKVIRPALSKYATAEKVLTDALVSNGDASVIDIARQDVMLSARQAVDVLHHLSDFVFKERSSGLVFAELTDVRKAVEAKCVFLRTSQPVADVSLLRDIADALKHHRPDRPSAAVQASTDVAPVSMGFGEARFGEGKFDGVEQVVIVTKDGDMRALSSVLQNVFDAWTTLLGQPLPPINEY